MAILPDKASVVRRILGSTLLLCALIGVLASNSSSAFASPKTGGVEKWVFQTGNFVVSSPAVASGVVYVGSDDYNVYAINAATGSKVWAFQTSSEVQSSPAVVGGVVYVGSLYANVYAITTQ